jgi:hypothetical protein
MVTIMSISLFDNCRSHQVGRCRTVMLLIGIAASSASGCGGSGGGAIGAGVSNGGTSQTAPQALSQSVVADEDGSIAIMLAGTDAEGDQLSFAITSGPSNGSLSGNPPAVTYTPDSAYDGADSFIFTVMPIAVL